MQSHLGVLCTSGTARAATLLLVLATLLITGGVPRTEAATITLVATLTNAQENPPVNPAPRPASSGTAQFVLDDVALTMTFTATISNIDVTGSQTADTTDNLTAAHIHAGPEVNPSTNGGVVWGFFGTPFNETSPNDLVLTPFASGVGGTISGKWDASEGNNTTLAAQLDNIRNGRSYINFHTVQFPGGEVRGAINAVVPAMSIDDVTVSEGDTGTTEATFTVSLSAASANTVTVNFATADGTAQSGADFVAMSGTLTFAPGQTSRSVSVDIVGDTIDEPDETFSVFLANPIGATIARSNGVGTITDDDAPLPQPPVAVDDAATTPFNTAVTVNVLANDSGDGIEVTNVSTPANGSAVENSDGSITYTPTAGFSGQDSFTYTITDDDGQTDTATVTVTVEAGPPPPPPPNAANDAATTEQGTPVDINVLANDNGAGLEITQVTLPANGTATENSDGTITYTPAAVFSGTDSFTYTVTDDLSRTDTATVTVTVGALNAPPEVSLSVPPPDGQNDWHRTSPVTVSVTATDDTAVAGLTCTGGTLGPVSGLGTPTATASVQVSSQGDASISCTATDAAGAASPTVTVGFQLDSLPPTATVQSITTGGQPYTPGQSTTQPVTVVVACSDATSGVTQPTVTTTVSMVGQDQTATGTCTDQAGNTASAMVSNIDIVAPLTLTSLSPTSGSTEGGTTVTISGSGLQPGATVSFGGTAASGASCTATGTQCIVTTPPHAPGPVAVTVTNPDGQTATLANAFTYVAPAPIVTSISPATGPEAGGTAVTISGEHLTSPLGPTTVSFGGAPAGNVHCPSPTQCQAVSPPGRGTVSVRVTVAGQTSADTAAASFTFEPPPQPMTLGVQVWRQLPPIVSENQTEGTIVPVVGGVVEALIGGVVCGQGVTDGQGRVQLVVAADPPARGCGRDGVAISFRVNGAAAAGDPLSFRSGGQAAVTLILPGPMPPPRR